MIMKMDDSDDQRLFFRYKHAEGELVSGVVRSIGADHMVIDLGDAEAFLAKEDSIPGEELEHGAVVKAYLSQAELTSHGLDIRLSRASPMFLFRLLENEIPQVMDGPVEIMSVARVPGVRARVAVRAIKPNIDPVDVCSGEDGFHLKRISSELHGEVIELVRFHDDIEAFVCEALRPALIQSVTIDHDAHSVNVSIADGQRKLALGQDEQGIRLAEELTGWKINIQVTRENEEAGGRARTPTTRGGYMRDLLFIVTTLALVGVATYWLIPLTGFPFSVRGLWIVTIGTALFAGILVLLGESIIEDGMKVGMMLVLTGLLWAMDGRFGFFVGCVILAGAAGTAMNQLNRTLARSASAKGNSNGK